MSRRSLVDAMPAVLLPEIMQFLDVAGAATAGASCRRMNEAAAGLQARWRREAERRFGKEAVARVKPRERSVWRRELAKRTGGAAAAEDDRPEESVHWGRYLERRSYRADPPEWPSPVGLAQERFMKKGPFQVLAFCILGSRTSGSEVIANAIDDILAMLPDPASWVALEDAAPEALLQLTAKLHPLGMQEQRLRAMRRMADGYVHTDWEDPMELYGIGPFGAESYRLFSGNPTPLHEVRFGKGVVTDRCVRSYANWLEHATGGGREVLAKAPSRKRRASEFSGDAPKPRPKKKRVAKPPLGSRRSPRLVVLYEDGAGEGQ